jgi:hypothetical protein
MIGPSIRERNSTFNGFFSFVENMDIITETIPKGIKAIVKVLSLRLLPNFQK